MINERKILTSYFNILEENKSAKYLDCKQISVSYNSSDSIDKLWSIHDQALKNQQISDINPKFSLLDLKTEIACKIYKNCCFCERRCGINRNNKTGNCKVEQTRIASEFLHIGEERVLIPSHTIFLSGCTFHCEFCQNWDISQENTGFYIEPKKTAEIIHKGMMQGSKNVNWVGGDPTPNLLYILQVLKELNENIPQIWNSNMYCSRESMKLLEGLIDLYLTDFKYGNDICAKRLSKIDNYLEIIQRNHKIAYENGDMIIRHLVLPNHVECCSKPIIKWISENLSNSAMNIMGQYRPEFHARNYEDISRYVSSEEVAEARKYASELNIYQI
jgi:putative pyruvate formate lyase activating enzyme